MVCRGLYDMVYCIERYNVGKHRVNALSLIHIELLNLQENENFWYWFLNLIRNDVLAFIASNSS